MEDGELEVISATRVEGGEREKGGHKCKGREGKGREKEERVNESRGHMCKGREEEGRVNESRGGK